jgi:polysaccharide biosynthesis transport protein
MNSNASLNSNQTLHLLRTHAKLWVVPTVVITLAALAYAVFHQGTWEAAQALIVRNEAAGGDKTPGKFAAPEEMKTVQETILEMAKSRNVLAAALREVGPTADCNHPKSWPTARDVVEFRDSVKLVAPKGAEYGKTEVFYLNVRADSSDRSIALNEAIFKELRKELQNLRDAKAESMISELTKTVGLANADLDAATEKLAATETKVGSDLAELRAMQDAGSADSALRRSAEEIRAQVRETTLTEKTNRELLVVLKESESDPSRFVAAPNRLLESYPSLRRLKDGLVDAQLRTAALQGAMSDAHPKVLAAKETEAEIRTHLRAELTMAERSVEVEQRVLADRRELLENQLTQTNLRLHTLAAVRAGYVNETTEVKNRSSLLERAEQNLADARAAQAGAKAASLISRIDTPDAGIRPIGPGRTTIVLGGLIGGLLAGFGVLFLVVPMPAFASSPATTAAPAVDSFAAAFRCSSTKPSAVRSAAEVDIREALQGLAR